MKTALFKRLSTFTLALLFILTTIISLLPAKPAAALSGSGFMSGRIMDDPVFFDSNRMNIEGIQAFLNSKVPVCDNWGTQPYAGTTRAAYAASKGVGTPFTCLKDFHQEIPNRGADQYCTGPINGGYKSAAHIIKDVANACSVSPMVLLVLLQKEQALVTDDWPWPIQYQKATGFGCPDTAPCDTTYSGFFNQVWQAGRAFQRYIKDSQSYGYRANRDNLIYYHPNTGGCGGSGVYIQNKATAALYNYTPYQPNAAALANLYGTGDGCSSYGNRNFWRLYNDWFGSPVTSACGFDDPLPVITDVKMRKTYPNIDSGDLVIYSGTGTQCIESHTWGNNFGSWITHTSSNRKVLIPNDCTLKYADLTADGRDEPILLCFRNTGSGKVEFHVWNYDMKSWIVHAISNLPVVNPAEVAIEFADMNADGRDEPIAFGYSNTGSGMVEFHSWNEGLQSWRSHIISNLPTINPANMNIAFGDLNGDGADEAIAIGVANTGTGKIEFHVWNPGQWSWQNHIVSNQPLVNTSDFGIVFGNFRGWGPDQGVLVGKRNTGSGRIEFHIWNWALTGWDSNNASNQPTF